MSTHSSDSLGDPARVARQTSPSARARGRWLRRIAVVLLIISGLLTFGYAGASTYAAATLVYRAQLPLSGDPGRSGLTYTDVAFPARGDGAQINGWVIPGVLPNGRLTDDRILIVVHGIWKNRTDPSAGVLEFSVALARHGFAVLALDLRGMGESQPAPLSMGYYEQRDVLGAVDFIQHGAWPYPALSRPRVIGG
jgi:hypothetical protein